MCAACIIAAINTIASCFPNLLPAKIMWYFSGMLIRHAHGRILEAEVLNRQEVLENLLLRGFEAEKLPKTAEKDAYKKGYFEHFNVQNKGVKCTTDSINYFSKRSFDIKKNN